MSGSAAYPAETVYSAASRQDPLDNTGGSARAAALGSCFVGIADDSSSVFWNPAGLSGLESPEASANHSSWFGETFHEVLVVGVPMRGVGGFGVTGNYLGYGSFEGRDFTGAPATDYTANQMGLGVGWGRRIVGDLSMGAGLHGAQQTFAEKSYSLFGGDLGVLLRTKYGWRFGLSYINLGLNRQGEKMASSFRMGLSRRWNVGNQSTLLGALGGTMKPQIGNSFQAGLEGTYRSSLSLRAGYNLQLQKSGFNGLQGLTTGVGLTLKSFRLDYAYLPYGDIGNSQRISLCYQLGSSPPRSMPATQAVQVPLPALPPVQAPAPAALPSPVQVVPQAAGNTAASARERTITMEFEIPAGEATAQAKALVKEGRYAEALQAYRTILQNDPKNVPAWREMGTVYHRLGRKQYAVRCFEEVLKLKPDDKALADWLARYKAQGVESRPASEGK